MFRLLMCLLLLASCVFVEVELRKVGRKFKVKKVRNKLAKKKPEAKPTTYFYNYVDDTSLSWENASYYCQDRWGVVVTIPDQQTQDYLAGWLTRENIAGPVYLGIEKYEKKGGGRGWRFFNETEVEYTNWAPGEPNEESNRCAVIR
ncbi:low affinity immunoglobulin epsilon Fc receptor-like [Ptychodera flava]|uniref:low affinity immunoglobulin epsilon Fc receptor-like n=1 Tax=Ptychodera flava TaxID=63121 RepID=UPI00396A43C0